MRAVLCGRKKQKHSMWVHHHNHHNHAKPASAIKKGAGNGLVAVAIDKDKGSQYALKWAADTLLTRGQTVILLHVSHPSSSSSSRGNEDAIVCNVNSAASASPQRNQIDNATRDLFLTFHCYCTRKDINCLDVLLEDNDVVKAVTEYVAYAAIENLVVGAPSRHGFIRFKTSTTPSSISKGAPDFCTVYVLSKGKPSSVRTASRQAPHTSPLLVHINKHFNNHDINQPAEQICSRRMNLRDRPSMKPHGWQDESMKSTFGRAGRGTSGMICMDFTESDTDISFVSSGRPSSACSSSIYDYMDSARTSRVSTSSDRSFGSNRLGLKFNDPGSPDTSFSLESGRTSCSSHTLDDAEADMRRLKLELKQTMDMYSTACREALTAQHKLMEMSHWKMEEEKKLEQAELAQEAALAIAEREKARSKAAMEAAEAARKIANVELKRRSTVEVKACKETEELRKLLDNLGQTDVRYRRYSIEEIEVATHMFSEKQIIGEGGYGPVYKCYLDHTPVAVKVLRPDAAQGKSQFQQEVDILSCMRHPNLVLLLGACPEYGILVYEYMANGSLDECLTRKKKDRVLCWQLRFRIAAEIATGLLFLHQTKPEPLVHRDLKPGNILLDQNYVCKISDVGLARLVPAVADNVTQCRMTSAAGTFCYIDPEYQQTGMLGVKSDVYSLGIIFLQLLTGRHPMGLAHHSEQAIENGTFEDMLDPCVSNWPVEQAVSLGTIAVECAQLRRKDRPDLAKEVMPKLVKLREFADENMGPIFLGGGGMTCINDATSPDHSEASVQQEVMSDPQLLVNSGSSTPPPTPPSPTIEENP
ncbi:U-box domain-containing protein 35-like isoform X2 [Vicia villosa]|uniref:U-box domain-containing protein 35-like isoform X2 n=1 Tax=Vicia villosa TaxID=3911 RepID=UPI00273BEB30|nr:U-box domain-containing protein 35-like isoform X2 [Vicia villosa]